MYLAERDGDKELLAILGAEHERGFAETPWDGLLTVSLMLG